MEFKKENLTTRHVVKLKGEEICFVGEQLELNTPHLIFYTAEQFGSYFGKSSLYNIDKDLKQNNWQSKYVIMAIKEYTSTSEAYYAVLNNKVENWDWEREKKSEASLKYKEMQNDLKQLQNKINKFVDENNL